MVPDLDLIFNAKAKSFRELLLTILVAKALDPTYSPSTDLYACSPRPLFEGPIRRQLTDLGVPRGKSGPVNMAKATQALNRDWAARRREKDAAMALVRIAKWLDAAPDSDLSALRSEVARRFLLLAVESAELFVEIDPREDLARLVSLSHALMQEAPAGGATAQVLVGAVLSIVVPGAGSVSGHLDSVYATNTTSRKAGDIIISPQGSTPHVVEVTQKRFDLQRMEDSYQAVRDMDAAENRRTSRVLVLCRDEDVPAGVVAMDDSPADTYRGTATLLDLEFEFVNLFGWVASQLATMTAEQRSEFHDAMRSYARDPNTSPSVKLVWAGHAPEEEEE